LYGRPPCTNQFIFAHFHVEIIINLCWETSYLNEEVNCTELSPSVSVPWLKLYQNVCETPSSLLLTNINYSKVGFI
jgi:hypothetical protein